MRALVKTKIEPGNFQLMEIDTPVPGPDQVRIKVKRAGICQTDNVYINEGGFALHPPVVLGHEVSGVVDMVGSNVEGISIGDRVLSQTTYHVCGHCRFCKRGEFNHCPERRGIGSAANGAFAEYVVTWKGSVMKMPDSMTFDQAASIEPLSCGVHALTERTQCGVNDVVVILGPGPIGLYAAQVAKAQGSYVIVAGLTHDAPRMELALKLGIDRAVDLQKEDLGKICKELTEGYGADVVVEATGSSKAVDLAMNVIARRGTFVPMGVFNHTIDVDFHNIKKKELTVQGSHAQIPTSWEKAIRLVRLGKVNVDAIISHVFPMSQWEDAFEVVKNKQGLKVMIDPEH